MHTAFVENAYLVTLGARGISTIGQDFAQTGEQQLLALAHNVLVATIVRQKSVTSTIPEPQLSVLVCESFDFVILGSADGEVFLNEPIPMHRHVDWSSQCPDEVYHYTGVFRVAVRV